MDLETARNTVISGYSHPEKVNATVKAGVYKTFDETAKAKKNEVFGTVTATKQYSTYGELEEELCPECNEKSVKTCPCGYSDKSCANNHSWYTDRSGTIKKGNPHC